MMRTKTSLLILVLALLCSASALFAAPRYACVVVGTREVVLSSRAVVEDGAVYAPTDLLKQLDADYVVGEHKVSIAFADKTVEIELSKRNGSNMFRVEDVAKALDAEYCWENSNSKATLLSKLTAVEFKGSTLTAKLTLPAAVSYTRQWTDPWRISVDLAGVKVAVPERIVAVGGADVSQLRIGQFNPETARVVVEVKKKLPFKVLTKTPGREVKVAIGRIPAEITPPPAQPQPTVEPVDTSAEQAPAVTINSVTAEPDGDSKIIVKISTSGQAVFSTRMFQDPLRIAVDIRNAKLAVSDDVIEVEHPLLTSVRAGNMDGTVRVVLDVTKYVAYNAYLEGNDIIVCLEPPVATGGRLSEKTIVIDPGHGGLAKNSSGKIDPGAMSQGVNEKTINLAIARQIKSALEAVGAKVILTRDGDDSSLDLASRPAVADRYGADIFISIHCNAIGVDDKLSGIETYYHPGQPRSKQLALCIHNSVVQKTGMKDRRARPRPGLAVLRLSHVPSILLECGYIDCTYDRTQLCDDTYRSKLAQAVVEGLKNYVEGRTGSGVN